MDRVFIYWDNSNIFHEAQRLAEERREGANARYRVRVNFDNILRLAHADRPLKKALATGSVPPEMRQLWNRMESKGGKSNCSTEATPGAANRKCPTGYCSCGCWKMHSITTALPASWCC